jgi:predicted site-specific integrase-resolvase
MKFLEEKTKESDNEDALVRIEEFAMLIGNVSTSIIKRYLREGRIKGVKISRTWFIPLKEVERILGPRKS